ncbi:MAG: TIGR04076 family protein [Anaerolineae bacterium]|nr:TIGR04076 family protein [Anaerolineae bacterium]
MADESGAYRVICKVVRQEGHCAMGHQVGDEVIMDESGVHGTICFHALYSLIPKAFAMMYGANFPWLEDKDVTTHACPDAENPVVFEVRRVR